MTPNKIKLIK